MKGTKSINGFSEKNSHLASWALLDLKMAHPHNSGSTVRIFLKFCVMKRANRQTRVVLMVGTKKSFVQDKWAFWARKWTFLITLDRLH